MVSPVAPPSGDSTLVETVEESAVQQGEISTEELELANTVNRLIKPVVEELSLKLKTASDLSQQCGFPIVQVVILHLNDQCQQNIESLEAANKEEKAVMEHVAKAAYELAEKVCEATGDSFSMTNEEKLIATTAYGYPGVVTLTRDLIEEAPLFIRKLTLVYPQAS